MASVPELRRLLYRVAKAYYDDGLTQQQIAERFGLSRVKVSRLLRAAREEKVVQITIAPPQESNAEIERRLEKRYGLKEALVVACSGDDTRTIVDELGPVAAACLARGLQGNEVVALSWGTSVLSVVSVLPAMDLPNVRVVQLLGGLGELEAETHGAELARWLAQTLGAKPRLIRAPAIVKDKAVRDALVTDPQVADTLELAGRADVALVGIGAFESGSTLLASGNIVTDAEVEDLKAHGVVGDIALQFFDEDGRKVEHPVNDRIIGTDIEKIRRIRRVIGVAGGVEKMRAIRAALRGGVVNVLVTDDQTAARLLDEDEPGGASRLGRQITRSGRDTRPAASARPSSRSSAPREPCENIRRPPENDRPVAPAANPPCCLPYDKTTDVCDVLADYGNRYAPRRCRSRHRRDRIHWWPAGRPSFGRGLSSPSHGS